MSFGSRAPSAVEASCLLTDFGNREWQQNAVDDLGSLMIRHVKGRPGALSVSVGEQRDEQYDNRQCNQEDVNDSLSDGDHCETREPGSGSRIDVQFAVLHPWKVDSAKNLTEDSEAS